MGDSDKVVGEVRRDYAVTFDDLQYSVTYGFDLWGRELGSDGCSTEGDGGVPP